MCKVEKESLLHVRTGVSGPSLQSDSMTIIGLCCGRRQSGIPPSRTCCSEGTGRVNNYAVSFKLRQISGMWHTKSCAAMRYVM
jgi:hypothetical protein